MALVVRLKPYDPSRGHLLQNFTYRNFSFTNRTERWYEVDDALAEELGRFTQRGESLRPGEEHGLVRPAFDVCTVADARALVRRERLEALAKKVGKDVLDEVETVGAPPAEAKPDIKPRSVSIGGAVEDAAGAGLPEAEKPAARPARPERPKRRAG